MDYLQTLYVICSKNFDSLASVARNKGSVYVGTVDRKKGPATRLNEHVQQPKTHGKLFEAWIANNQPHIVSKTDYFHLVSESENPTPEERAEMNRLERMGCKILNTLR